jgi:hypothetical protein
VDGWQRRAASRGQPRQRRTRRRGRHLVRHTQRGRARGRLRCPATLTLNRASRVWCPRRAVHRAEHLRRDDEAVRHHAPWPGRHPRTALLDQGAPVRSPAPVDRRQWSCVTVASWWQGYQVCGHARQYTHLPLAREGPGVCQCASITAGFCGRFPPPHETHPTPPPSTARTHEVRGVRAARTTRPRRLRWAAAASASPRVAPR